MKNSDILNKIVLGCFMQSSHAAQITSWLREMAIKHGYFGAFFLSFLGTFPIILPIPYTLTIFVLGGLLDPNLLALSAGFGSALGEFVGYLIGYYGGAFISEKRRKRIDPIMKIFNKYGAIIVFIFALTPLPDDLLLIPLGIMRFSIAKVFLPCLLGKIAMCFILAYGGRFSIRLIGELAGHEGGELLTTAIASILLVIFIIIIFKIDWEDLLLGGGYKRIKLPFFGLRKSNK